MSRSPRFGVWLEGKPVTIIRDGIYELRSLDSMNISADEFFMELRQQGVEHLGESDSAYSKRRQREPVLS